MWNKRSGVLIVLSVLGDVSSTAAGDLELSHKLTKDL